MEAASHCRFPRVKKQSGNVSARAGWGCRSSGGRPAGGPGREKLVGPADSRPRPSAGSWARAALGALAAIAGLTAGAAMVGRAAPATAAEAPLGDASWQSWGTETYRLEAGESFQFRVEFDQIPVRSWRLVVEGDYVLCDLVVLRLKDGSLLYSRRDESRHDVTIPWGTGEAISVALTAVRPGGVYTVRLLGPPPDSAPACYSYKVNRALEAYAVGRRDRAEALCRDALREDARDGAAYVMLAGFLRDRGDRPGAIAMVDEALSCDLPPAMQTVARQLQVDLSPESSREPNPELPPDLAVDRTLDPEVVVALERAENLCANDRAEAALTVCDSLLAGPALAGEANSEILLERGKALHRLGRRFEALDTYVKALAAGGSRAVQAVVYFEMGRLFIDMDNPAQATDALGLARKFGLPADLDRQAAELVTQLAGQQ